MMDGDVDDDDGDDDDGDGDIEEVIQSIQNIVCLISIHIFSIAYLPYVHVMKVSLQ